MPDTADKSPNLGASSSGTDRNPVEQLAEEFVARFRRGERPTVEEYADKHPELADEISELFPAMLMMEEMKPGAASVLDGLQKALELETVKAERLGDFRIIREIGRGGMGIVYEAEQESLGRRVALKVLPKNTLANPRRLERFRREAQAAAQLHHTNIVPVFGVGEQDGWHYYVMQYIEGAGLDHLLEDLREQSIVQAALSTISQSPHPADAAEFPSVSPAGMEEASAGSESSGVPTEALNIPGEIFTIPDDLRTPATPVYWRTVARIGMQSADALQYAHAHGTIHRDIKPANLMIDAQANVWITDFGLAKVLEEDNITKSGDVVGTLRYMSPEQLKGQADTRSDLFSLGLTLYELVALTPAYTETDRSRLLWKLAHEPPPPPSKWSPDIPKDLETIILKALAADPNDRYQSGAEMAEDLHRFLTDRPVRARRVSLGERAQRWFRRNRAVATLSFVAALSLLLATVVGWAGYVYTVAAWREESIRRDEAETATQLAESNVQLSLEAFEEIFEKIARQDRRPGGRDATGSEIALLSGILQFYDKFSEKNRTNLPLKAQAARAYRLMGEIYLSSSHPENADMALDRAIELYEELLENFPMHTEYTLALSELCSLRAPTGDDTGMLIRAEPQYQRALELAEKLVENQATDLNTRFALARAQSRVGQASLAVGKLDEAESLLREALKNFALVKGRIDIGDDDLFETARTHRLLAKLVAEQGKPLDARLLLDMAHNEFEQTCRSDAAGKAGWRCDDFKKQLVVTYQTVALALQELGREDDAAKVEERLKSLREERAAPSP